ncbi:MAG: UvrD-helicase domain-containing protein, partial [Rhodanobacteraceae bacterium]
MLTRQMPLVSEFGGFGEVIEDASEMYGTAARRALRSLAEGDAEAQALFRRVSLHFDNDVSLIESQIARMLAHRDQWWFLGSAAASDRAEDFRQLLERARAALARLFRERRAVDFTEITRAAIQALGTAERPTDLLYWLDYRIEHLLVDEFQDTSRAQYTLIEALTREWSDGDRRSLFLVGDPMQSIYRFREAEVSLFLRCWEERGLGSVRLTPVRLRTNFRSSPEIVAWTQQAFAPIMNEDDAARGGIKLRPAEAARPETRIVPRLISLVDDNGQREAREIVRIAAATAADRIIAILVRSRAHIAAVLPALRDANIPYEAIEIEQLGEQQHILDLLSLTRAILHLGDRVSWLACLRAPWCGLALGDLSVLAENEPERTIFDLLSYAAKIQALSVEGRFRAVRVQEILAGAVASAGREPLRELVERAWMALGGPAILETRSQREDAETFFGLIESVESDGAIHDLSRLEARLECLYAKPRAAGARVQVMTIHQAKGLEFDTVIVPKLDRGSGSADRELLI